MALFPVPGAPVPEVPHPQGEEVQALLILQQHAAQLGLRLAPVAFLPACSGYVLSGATHSATRAFDDLAAVQRHLAALGQSAPRAGQGQGGPR